MDSNEFAAKSMADMLQERIVETEISLRSAIIEQNKMYALAKEQTIRKLLGESNSSYNLIQVFKYQETIGNVLREMELTYREIYGKDWNASEDKPRRGRPKKA
jgi:hypothetical protein